MTKNSIKKYRGGLLSEKGKVTLRTKYFPPNEPPTIRELMQFVRDNKIKYDFEWEVTNYLNEIGSPIKPLPKILESVPMEERTKEVCLEALRINEWEIFDIPEKLQNAMFYLKAATINGLILQFIPPETPNRRRICLAAIKQNGDAIRYRGDGTKIDGELLAYAKYSDIPFDFVGYSDEKGYVERINKAVIKFLEPLAQKYETRQGFLESQQQLSGLQKHGFHHNMIFLDKIQHFAGVDVPFLHPDILMRYRKEYPRELKGEWVPQLIERKREEVFSNEAAAKDAALSLGESIYDKKEDKERDEFRGTVPEKKPSSAKDPPLVFPLTRTESRGGRKTRKKRKTRRR